MFKNISKPFLFLFVVSSVSCVKTGEVSQNYSVIKTETDEVQRVAGILLKESNRLLDGEFSGDQSAQRNWEDAKKHRSWEHVLYLPHLRSLNEVQAQAISENATWVNLNGLDSLSPDVAERMFVTGYEDVSLNALETISVELARHMSSMFTGIPPSSKTLRLNGVKELTPEVATEFIQGKGGVVQMNGVTSISDEVIRIIDVSSSDVWNPVVRFHLPNLELTSELAKKLPKATFVSVIEKEKKLSEELVQMIADSDLEYIHLDNLKVIQPEQVSSILRQKRRTLSLNGIKTLQADVAKEIVRSAPEEVILNGVESLSKDEIDLLVQSEITTLRLQSLRKKDYPELNKAFRKLDRNIFFQEEG